MKYIKTAECYVVAYCKYKQGSSRKIVAFFFAMNSGKRFGGLLWKEFIHTSVHLFVAIITFLNSLLQIQKPSEEKI